MEKGQAGEYSGNSKWAHKHYMENSVHDFETGHPVAGKYEAERASAFKMDDQFLSPVDGSDQNLDNSAEARFDSQYGMAAGKMSALKNRYSSAIPQTDPPPPRHDPRDKPPKSRKPKVDLPEILHPKKPKCKNCKTKK